MKKALLLLLFSISTFAQVDKVEPPFWWSDMNLSDVQIMFYGKNIAQNEVTVSNGIVIKGIQKTENPNYVFVTIDTKNANAQNIVFTFKNKKKSFLLNTCMVCAIDSRSERISCKDFVPRLIENRNE